MRKFALFLALFIITILTGCANNGVDKTNILYVPLDERPVNLAYVVETLDATPIGVNIPPEKYLPKKKQPGNTEKLWQWVFDNCKEVDYLVLSADTMIYGGLTPSRIHDVNEQKLAELVANFERVKVINPDVELYVFSTVMRTHRASTNLAEPDYYGTYGSQIFKITALRDKADMEGLEVEEEKQLKRLLTEVPVDVLDDWMDRRAKNFDVNTMLIDQTRRGVIDYFILSRDDTASYSQSSREYRALSKMAGDLPVDRFVSFPGADEVGLVLLTRAVNHNNGQTPNIFVRYAPGVGPNTIPKYEDQEIWRNIEAHIQAAGGAITNAVDDADLILAVNTPEDGNTGEAGSADNIVKQNAVIDVFVEAIARDVNSGRGVAVADIAFSNGADNTLMAALAEQSLLTKISAYGGWNTAGNAMGYALGQGVLAEYMDKEDAEHILIVRLLDDWAYQANVRGQVNREITAAGIDRNNLGSDEKKVLMGVKKKLDIFTRERLAEFNIKGVDVYYPWNRTFDIKVKPRY